jgi:hypothetical protein
MTWRSAFLSQAQSDNAVRKVLNRANAPYCHQLHFLQMSAEKLAKGWMASANSNRAPEPTLAAIVRCMQVIKGRPDTRRQLGYSHYESFAAFIDSLLPFADRIERLAPRFDTNEPNPEYPWRPTRSDDVIAPCEYNFDEFNPDRPQVIKFVDLLESLLKIAA